MLIPLTYALSTLAVLLIIAGLITAKDRRRHVPLMLAAFALDMIGLIIVEVVAPLVEGRIDPVRGLMEGGGDGSQPIDIVHASLAGLSLVGYAIQIVTGRKIMQGKAHLLGAHRLWGAFFVLTRLGAYVTMWMV